MSFCPWVLSFNNMSPFLFDMSPKGLYWCHLENSDVYVQPWIRSQSSQIWHQIVNFQVSHLRGSKLWVTTLNPEGLGVQNFACHLSLLISTITTTRDVNFGKDRNHWKFVVLFQKRNLDSESERPDHHTPNYLLVISIFERICIFLPTPLDESLVCLEWIRTFWRKHSNISTCCSPRKKIWSLTPTITYSRRKLTFCLSQLLRVATSPPIPRQSLSLPLPKRRMLVFILVPTPDGISTAIWLPTGNSFEINSRILSITRLRMLKGPAPPEVEGKRYLAAVGIR